KYIVFANNFMPIEKCHLRNTLHLYYTFRVFAYFMGLKRIEKCGANAIVYRRERFKQSLAWSWIRILEYCSRACYPLLRTLRGVYRLIVPLRSSSFVLQGECTPDAASDDGVTRDES
ncbi:MAG: hypothetical protein KAH23_02325, partial [Kiritimatiellae bacterium]|nr:hypothetical protein [Kiritimatiellia bacterium]